MTDSDLQVRLEECKEPEIDQIHIGNNKIMNTGVETLCNFMDRQDSPISLGIYDNRVSDIGARALAGSLGSLKKLFCQRNFIGNRGARYLAEALMYNRTLTMLSLEYNDIFLPGLINIAKSIRKNTVLRRLYITQYNVSEDDIMIIAKFIGDNDHLTYIGIINHYTNDVERYRSLIRQTIRCARNVRFKETIQQLYLAFYSTRISHSGPVMDLFVRYLRPIDIIVM